jgi:D-tyrosyl-tRNA(Tyr) deacylase
MRAVVQRVKRGKVTVDNRPVSEIGRGVVILLGIGHADGEAQVDFLAEKIATLRIFEDSLGKMNLSLLDLKGAALVVSQFTLYADTSKGRRPSFTEAALPEIAAPLVDRFAGAHMLVEIENDGPVTIFLER